MALFDWIIAAIILLVLFYLSFFLTLADWLSALRKGQAVTLLPERKGGTWPLWAPSLPSFPLFSPSKL